MPRTKRKNDEISGEEGENESDEELEDLEEPTVDWKTSAARQVILDDLAEGILPVDATALPPREAWEEVYKNMVEFAGVPYTQFRTNLNNHRKQYRRKRENEAFDAEAVVHDRNLHPPQLLNRRGKPVFYLSDAQRRLAKDVKKKWHLKYKPCELRRKRQVYRQFELAVFRQRIYQQVRREKFENHLEEQREKKRKARQEHLQSRNPLPTPGKRRKKAGS